MSGLAQARVTRRVGAWMKSHAFRSTEFHGLKVAFVLVLNTKEVFRNNISCSIEKHLACTYKDHGDYDPTVANGPNTVSSHSVVTFMAAFEEFADTLLKYIAQQPDFDQCNPSAAGVIHTSHGINFRTDTDWQVKKKYLHCFPAEADGNAVFDLSPSQFKAFHGLQKFFTTRCYQFDSAAIRKRKLDEAAEWFRTYGNELWFVRLLDLTPTETEEYIDRLGPHIEDQRVEEERDRAARTLAIKKETERKMEESRLRQASQQQDLEEEIGVDLDALGFM